MQMFVPRNSSDHRQPYTQPVTELHYQPLSVFATRRFRPTGQFSFHDRRFWELVDSSTVLPSSSFDDCRDRSEPHTAACYFFNVRAVFVVRWVSHLNPTKPRTMPKRALQKLSRHVLTMLCPHLFSWLAKTLGSEFMLIAWLWSPTPCRLVLISPRRLLTSSSVPFTRTAEGERRLSVLDVHTIPCGGVLGGVCS